MQNLLKFLSKNNIGEPPWDYYFLQNLDEKEYPRYLAKIFKYRTSEKLPLKYNLKNHAWIINKKRCKTFNQKIQWIKLYGITDLMRKCTDKITVRDYVKEKMGSEYLKPVLQICDNFDEIDFEKLPNSFVIKCNHGCKWHYIIKDKKSFLNNKRLLEIVKRNITGWLEQEYWCWSGFEMQYAISCSKVCGLPERKGCQDGIEPKILIEKLLREFASIQLYCFNGIPYFIIKKYSGEREISIYDKNLNLTNDIFETKEKKINRKSDDLIRKACELSKKLAENFVFVRIDFIVLYNNLFFEELTFTPHSGFKQIKNIEYNLELGNLINLKEYKNEF